MSDSFVFVPLYETVKAVQFVHTAATISASTEARQSEAARCGSEDRAGDSGVAEIVQVPVYSFNSSLTGWRPALGGMIWLVWRTRQTLAEVYIPYNKGTAWQQHCTLKMILLQV